MRPPFILLYKAEFGMFFFINNRPSLSLSPALGLSQEMGFLPCPLPCKSRIESENDQSLANYLHLESSSNSSLYSQPSLPSVPSLTPNSQQPSTANYQCLSTLSRHSSAVFSLVLAGKHLYSGSSDGQIRTWPRDPPSIQESSADTLAPASRSAAKSLVVLGGKIFSAHQDHRIRVWNIDGHKLDCIATLPTLGNRFTMLFSTKNYVQVRRHKKSTWVNHVDAISELALSKDGGNLLYSASWDRTFKIWRTSDFKCLESVQNAHDDAINSIEVSKDGVVYTGSADRKIKVWKKHEGEKKHRHVATLEKHKSAVNALALSADGSVLYSGACDRSIIVWEKDGAGAGHMAVAGALRGHSKSILSLAVVSDLVCSGSADKTVRIWRREVIGRSYCCLAVLEGHRSPVKCLTAAVDNNNNNSSGSGCSCLVYSGSLDSDIKVWKICVS